MQETIGWIQIGLAAVSMMAAAGAAFIASYYGTRSGLNGVKSDIRHIREIMAEREHRVSHSYDKVTRELDSIWEKLANQGERIAAVEKRDNAVS